MTKHISTDLSASAPTGGADANLADDYLRWIQEAVLADLNGFPGNILIYGTDATNPDLNAFSGTPTIDGYATGMQVILNKTGGSANATTTPSLNIDTLGAKTIKRMDGTALKVGDLVAGLNRMVYNGTDFLLLGSYSPSIKSGEFIGPLTGDVTGAVNGTTVSASGGFTGDLTGDVTGNADTATTATTATSATATDAVQVGLGTTLSDGTIEVFISSGESYTGAGQQFTAEAHGLSGTPQELSGYMVCTDAAGDNNYSLGDVVPLQLAQKDSATSQGAQLWADATNVDGRISSGDALWFIDKSSGSFVHPGISSDWDIYIIAKYYV